MESLNSVYFIPSQNVKGEQRAVTSDCGIVTIFRTGDATTAALVDVVSNGWMDSFSVMLLSRFHKSPCDPAIEGYDRCANTYHVKPI